MGPPVSAPPGWGRAIRRTAGLRLQRLHCTLEDPAAATGSAAEILATLRAIRNQIEGRMRELLAGITPPA